MDALEKLNYGKYEPDKKEKEIAHYFNCYNGNFIIFYPRFVIKKTPCAEHDEPFTRREIKACFEIIKEIEKRK